VSKISEKLLGEILRFLGWLEKSTADERADPETAEAAQALAERIQAETEKR
jgi:hypothetical protein